MTPSEYRLRCQCGTVQGVLTNLASTNRVVCYCKDCQAFAHALGQSDSVLDSRGGSDIVQALPRDLRFTQGLDAVACLRLTPKGLFRWYAGCCRTPIGNTLSTPKWSFIGLVHTCLDSSEVSLDEAFGPVRTLAHTKGALGDPKPKEKGIGRTIGWFLRTTLKARLNGDYKRSPFFSPTTGAAIVTPRVLTSDAGLPPGAR
ncbi:MAG TPA: DUF6151 family protein [Steroidobacteraceae bacterium]